MAVTGIGTYASYTNSYGNTQNAGNKTGRTYKNAHEYKNYLTQKYECLRSRDYSVNINSSLLSKAMGDEKTKQWLEYNLSLIPKTIEQSRAYVAARGAKILSYSMYIHRPEKDLSIAENFLRLLRPDTKFTELEARVLDIALLLHMEHGGGNNSTFTTRVVTSSGSDTYSVISAAMSSLKGKKHGGANLMVMNMMDDIKSHVKDYEDEEEIASYLSKILNKEAFDQKGLIYGMGHAVYSISDPRERVFKGFVEQLARDKGREKDMTLYNNIEKIAPKLIAKQRQIFKGVSPNIDFYSGFVYDMLNIPRELYTPLFAIARIAGWSAHRLEELITTDKIIRPAYKSLVSKKEYIEREER